MNQNEITDIPPRTTAAPPAGAECSDPNCKLCAGWPPEPPTDEQAPVSNEPDSGTGMTLGEAIEALRQGKRIRHEDWEPGAFIKLGALGEFYDEDGDSIDWHITFRAMSGTEARPWHLSPSAAPPADLTTAESLAALADGKRVRQVHPCEGPSWWLKDGFYRSSKGTIADTIQITATDLLNSRYRIEA